MKIGFGLLAFAFLLGSAELPSIPHIETAHFLPLIRAQVDRAEARARANPVDAELIGALAMTLHAYGEYDSAEQAYLRAEQLDPHNFDWPYLLAATQMAEGKFDSAVVSFRTALQLRPQDLPAQLRLGESLMALAQWDEGRDVYRNILAKHPDCARAWYGLGRSQAAAGDHRAAALSYAKACEIFPRYGTAHFALAAALRRTGQSAQAEPHLAAYASDVTTEPPLDDPLFQRVHELNLSTQAHLQYGAELDKAGDLTSAIREQEAALVSDSNSVQAHVNLISLYARAGDTNRAKQHFEAAIKLNPGRSDAWYDYGILLSKNKQTAEAERAYRHALEIDPYYAEAHNNLALLYEEQGRLEDAAREFRDEIADRPDYPPARFHLGRILVNQEKYDEAIHQFLLALHPETDQTPTYLYALGATYARAGDRFRARDYLQKAHQEAVHYRQVQLLASIERDLQTLAGQQ